MSNNVRRFTRYCQICGKEFLGWHLKNKFCSPECFKKHVSRRRTKISEELLIQAMTLPVETDPIQWLMQETKASRHTVYVTLRRHNVTFFPKPRTNAYERAIQIERQFARETGCVICGESRSVDAAHLIPAKLGGAGWIPNIIPLCPNHHRIFDKGELTDAECQAAANWIVEEFGAENFTEESFANRPQTLGDCATTRDGRFAKPGFPHLPSSQPTDSKAHG